MATDLCEIITRAVVKRAERRVSWHSFVPTEAVSAVLGVRMGPSRANIVYGDGEAVLELAATCDIWCAGSDGSHVLRYGAIHTEVVKMDVPSNVVDEPEVTISLIGSIRTTNSTLKGNGLMLWHEANALIEMTGLARLWVAPQDLARPIYSESDESGDQSGTGSGDESGDDSGDDSGDGSGDQSGTGSGDESGDESGQQTEASKPGGAFLTAAIRAQDKVIEATNHQSPTDGDVVGSTSMASVFSYRSRAT